MRKTTTTWIVVLLCFLVMVIFIKDLNKGFSSADLATCESLGGTTVSEEFPFKSQILGEKTTGDLNYCKLPNGNIGKISNAQVTSVNEGVFGDSGDNVTIFNECKARGGNTYLTQTRNKKSKTFYLCVVDGHAIKILS